MLNQELFYGEFRNDQDPLSICIVHIRAQANPLGNFRGTVWNLNFYSRDESFTINLNISRVYSEIRDGWIVRCIYDNTLQIP